LNPRSIKKDALKDYPLIGLAEIYIVVGEYDLAIDKLELLLSIPSDISVGRLKIEAEWDPLRDHPRFKELIKKYE